MVKKKTTCADHTPCPEGYLQWHHWAEEMSRTHKSIKCDECGRYSIWIEKDKNKEYEKIL